MPDRPGELAKLLKFLAAESINIDAMSANSGSQHTFVSLITNQPIKTRQCLRKAGYAWSQRTVIVVSLDDRPGSFAALAKKLGEAGVDIESVVPLEVVGDRVQLAIGVDNRDAARALV